MKEKLVEVAIERIETTIGELVSTITEIAMESGKSEEEGYELASVTLERILNESNKSLSLVN